MKYIKPFADININDIKLKDGSMALGTISNGLVLIDDNGEINYQINKDNGLNNNYYE